MTTLHALFDLYRSRRLIGASPNTIKRYQVTLRHLTVFLEHEAQTEDLTEDTVTLWIGWLTDKGCAPATVNGMLKGLLSLWRFACRRQLCGNWPEIQKLREPNRCPTSWSIDQLSRILESCQKEQGTLTGVSAPAFWTAVVLLLYDTGMRPGAAWQLRQDNVDLIEGRAFVPAEIQKQKADQQFSLHPQTVDALKAIWEPERELVFPWLLHWQMRYSIFRRILKRAGLPSGRRDLFYRIRRTAATQAEIAMGAGSATALLGHSDPRVARAHYLDTSAMPSRQIAQHLPRPRW